MTTTGFKIVVPNLRNGRIEDIHDAAPSASIPERFYWTIPRNIPLGTETQYVFEYMAAQFGSLTKGTDYAANATTMASARREAIILGASRATMAQALRLTTADMTTEECKWSAYSYRQAETDAELEARRAELLPDANIAEDGRAAELDARRAALTRRRAGLWHGAGTETARDRAGRESAFLALTAEEWEVANAVGWMALATAILQGVSLVKTGHHYIDTTKKDFAGLYKQAKFLMHASWKTLEEAMGADLNDRLFHKSAHPIRPDFKRGLAVSHEMKARLIQARIGSAATRLPALPAESQGLKAGLACIKKASSTLTQLGAEITTTDGDALLTELEGRGESVLNADMLKAKILEAQEWWNIHQGDIALCAGVLDQMHTLGQGTSDRPLKPETTTGAFSVVKAISANTAQYVLGGQIATIAMKKDQRDIESKGRISKVIRV